VRKSKREKVKEWDRAKEMKWKSEIEWKRESDREKNERERSSDNTSDWQRINV
jgi:hypothetical protein